MLRLHLMHQRFDVRHRNVYAVNIVATDHPQAVQYRLSPLVLCFARVRTTEFAQATVMPSVAALVGKER